MIRGVDRGQGMELAGSLLGDIQEAASQCFSLICASVSLSVCFPLSPKSNNILKRKVIQRVMYSEGAATTMST